MTARGELRLLGWIFVALGVGESLYSGFESLPALAFAILAGVFHAGALILRGIEERER